MAGHHADATLNAFAMSLSQETHSDCYTIYRNSIIYIYNLSARNKNKAAFAASILPLLQDNLMTACCTFSSRTSGI
ncbi:MAG TPA: hypothetical protein DF613_15390 [Lachnospiraceae bacterium]|nr:hypothetical protein [Lachnospiraceae bacterium]